MYEYTELCHPASLQVTGPWFWPRTHSVSVALPPHAAFGEPSPGPLVIPQEVQHHQHKTRCLVLQWLWSATLPNAHFIKCWKLMEQGHPCLASEFTGKKEETPPTHLKALNQRVKVNWQVSYPCKNCIDPQNVPKCLTILWIWWLLEIKISWKYSGTLTYECPKLPVFQDTSCHSANFLLCIIHTSDSRHLLAHRRFSCVLFCFACAYLLNCSFCATIMPLVLDFLTMNHKKVSAKDSDEKEMTSIEVKCEIIEKHEQSLLVVD